MYQRIVVATDRTTRGNLAVRVASSLGRQVRALELVTVASPDTEPAVARWQLELAAARNGWLPAACSVLAADDVAEALVAHVERRSQALLTMASHGPHPMTPPALGNVTRRVLARTSAPVLVVGPNTDPAFTADAGELIVCVDGPDAHPSTIAAIEEWVRSFAATAIWVVEVVPASIDVGGAGDEDVRRWADALALRGLSASTQVLHGGDPVRWLDDFASQAANAIYVATSTRYCTAARHLHSTTRELIHRGARPVLVVPIDRPVDARRRNSSQDFGAIEGSAPRWRLHS